MRSYAKACTVAIVCLFMTLTFGARPAAAQSNGITNIQVGTDIPSTCDPRQAPLFFSLGNPQGLMYCTTNGTYTLISSSGPSAVSRVFGRTGAVGAMSGDYSCAE